MLIKKRGDFMKSLLFSALKLNASVIQVCIMLAILCGAAALQVRAENYTITTFAGPVEIPGAIDGTGSAARFYYPNGVAVDSSGNVYVADTDNHIIRKITAAGVVSTLAGTAGSSGNTDGTGSAARFDHPYEVTVDSSVNVYVADTYNHTIRKITEAGEVTTLAGIAGSSGSADGTGSAARFNRPHGVAVDSSGNVYVADTYNHTIRKITVAGEVTTLAGIAGSSGSADGIGSAARFYYPNGVAVDSSGNAYVADSFNNIRKITAIGVVTTLAGTAGSSGSSDGTGSAARFQYPNGVAVDSSGNVYVADTLNHSIRKITAGGVVTTLAGAAFFYGNADGAGSVARFSYPNGVAVDSSGNVYVADTLNHTIRKITAGGVVTTLAGTAVSIGSADGTGHAARFSSPNGVAVDSSGNIYVADTYDSKIRKITALRVVTTLGGSAAQFSNPRGVAVDSFGNVYVAATDSSIIRKITIDGVVTTLAGTAGSIGNADGVGNAARFDYPRGVAVDSSGNVYVADTGNSTIRKITAAGVVTTLAGTAGSIGNADGTGAAARFDHPQGVAVDSSANVYVADTSNHTIRKITALGVVTTLAGNAVSYPSGVAVDSFGNVYVADTGNHTIRKITTAGVVTTLAGSDNDYGNADGTGSAAQFNYPRGVAVDRFGNVYVADTNNSSIRKGRPALSDIATIDQAIGTVSVVRQLDTVPQTATDWNWSIFRRPAGSSADLSTSSVRNPTFTPDAAGFFQFRLTAGNASGASISVVSLDVGPPFVKVMAPNNEEIWLRNTLHVIQWNSNTGGNVKIELLKDGALNDTIISSVANASPFTYSWTIPASQSAGNDYKIRVTTTDNLYTDTSDYNFSIAPAAPVNDNFANRIVLNGSSVIASGSNVSATSEVGEPTHAGYGPHKSVWWSWTAPSFGKYILKTSGSNFDTRLAVYTGTSVSALTLVTNGSNDDDASLEALTSLVSINVTPGTTYQIAVDGYREASGDISLAIIPGPVGPTNDNFSGRTILTGSAVTTTASNVNASKEPGEPNHSDVVGGASLWWTWIAPATGKYGIKAASSGIDTLLAVYTGTSVSMLIAVASTNNFDDLFFNATLGTEYQIAVDGYGGGMGDITLSIFPGPANDDFAFATSISGTSATVTGDNGSASKETAEPNHAGESGGKSLWWSWTPSVSGLVTISTAGSKFDTLLAIYTGSTVLALTQVASNDQFTDNTSQVVFMAVAGTTYAIAVDGYYGDVGSVSLSLICEPAVPVNHPPVITSPPSATEIQFGMSGSHRIIGFNFTIAATDADGDPLSYVWDFGDGLQNTGSSRTIYHVYNSPGTFTAVVTISDGRGGSVSASVTVNASAPGGKAPFTITKFQASVKFMTSGHDICSLSGIMPDVPDNFNPAGVALTLNIGGVEQSFTLNAKGRARSANATAALKLKSSKGSKPRVFQGGPVPFTVTMMNGAWHDLWLDEGVSPNSTQKNSPVTMKVSMTFNGDDYESILDAFYSGQAGIVGKLRDPKR